MNLRIGAAERLDNPPVVWKSGISVPDTNYLRLQINIEGPPPPESAALYLFSELEQEFKIPLFEIPESGYWTGLIPNGRVTLALFTPDPLSDDTTVILSNQSIQQDDVLLYSQHGENQLWPIASPKVPPEVQALAGPVAFLSFFDAGLPRTCTGFLIEPDLMLTNEHCIRSEETCSTMTAVFGYQRNAQNGLEMGPQFRCTGYEARFSNFALDVTAVRLSGRPGDDFGMIDISETPTPAPDGPLIVIQHPGDLPKQVSIAQCAALQSPVAGRAPESDFTHTCDTAQGSSGAPILNTSGQLVGVHHFGFRDAPDSVWRDNRGVLAPLIQTWLQENIYINQ